MTVALRGNSQHLLLGPAEKSTFQAHAYAQLREAIMLGKLVPGQPTSIRSLAAALGTSHIPVREALMRLSAERAIAILPNGSVAVPAMSRARFEDLRRTRCLVEGHAVELATPRLAEADFRKMEAAYKKRETALRAENYHDAMQFGQRSRFVIYYATGSETLVPIIESLWLQVGPFFNLSAAGGMPTQSAALQRQTIDALRKRDAKHARKLVVEDIMEVGEKILSLLPQDAV